MNSKYSAMEKRYVMTFMCKGATRQLPIYATTQKDAREKSEKRCKEFGWILIQVK